MTRGSLFFYLKNLHLYSITCIQDKDTAPGERDNKGSRGVREGSVTLDGFVAWGRDGVVLFNSCYILVGGELYCLYLMGG
jgi:hypothetical protein